MCLSLNQKIKLNKDKSNCTLKRHNLYSIMKNTGHITEICPLSWVSILIRFNKLLKAILKK